MQDNFSTDDEKIRGNAKQVLLKDTKKTINRECNQGNLKENRSKLDTYSESERDRAEISDTHKS